MLSLFANIRNCVWAVVIFITGGAKFYLDIPPETPAFLCEKMGVELDLKKMADMTVDDMIQKQNVLYISRGQLKKHTSTILNISLNVRYISQQVNAIYWVIYYIYTNVSHPWNFKKKIKNKFYLIYKLYRTSSF